jgi:hypothetical protein
MLTDKELKVIGKEGRQSLLYMREIAKAQEEATAREIIRMIEDFKKMEYFDFCELYSDILVMPWGKPLYILPFIKTKYLGVKQ